MYSILRTGVWTRDVRGVPFGPGCQPDGLEQSSLFSRSGIPDAREATTRETGGGGPSISAGRRSSGTNRHGFALHVERGPIQMSYATILGRSQSQMLGDVGCALLQIKNARGLTLEDMGYHIGVSREMVAQYIAGEAEMGFVKWLRVNEAFPELSERIEETAADRILRSKQRVLDLDLPRQREQRDQAA